MLKDVAECWIRVCPAGTDRGGQRLLLGTLPAELPPTCVAAVQDQVRDPFGVAGRVGKGDGRSLGYAEQSEAVDAYGVHHCLEVCHPRVDREVADLTVRQAAPALVVPDQRVAGGEPLEPMPPDRALPVELEVRQPGCRPYDRRPVPVHRVGESHTIGCGAKPDLLIHAGRMLVLGPPDVS